MSGNGILQKTIAIFRCQCIAAIIIHQMIGAGHMVAGIRNRQIHACRGFPVKFLEKQRAKTGDQILKTGIGTGVKIETIPDRTSDTVSDCRIRDLNSFHCQKKIRCRSNPIHRTVVTIGFACIIFVVTQFPIPINCADIRICLRIYIITISLLIPAEKAFCIFDG